MVDLEIDEKNEQRPWTEALWRTLQQFIGKK